MLSEGNKACKMNDKEMKNIYSMLLYRDPKALMELTISLLYFDFLIT